MADRPEYDLRRLHGRLNELLDEFGRMRFTSLAQADAWRPAINVFWERNRITICVELAGVERQAINLSIHPHEVRLSGRRAVPEPTSGNQHVQEILALEIDHGPFQRVITLPAEVDPRRAEAESHNGLIWIYLPLAGGPNK